MDFGQRKIAAGGGRFMPLVSMACAPGACRQTIEVIEDADARAMAWAEYCQFTGRAEEALSRAKPYLDHDDLNLRLSALLVYFVSGMGIGDDAVTRWALAELEEIDLEQNTPVSGVYCANALKIMLFLRETEFAVGEDVPDALPEGVRFFVCYFLALREYLRDEYENAVGMAKVALMMGGRKYPVAGVFLHLISAASMVRLKKTQAAEQQFQRAWELAGPDGLIAPFGMQFVMLAGLNKRQIKPRDAEAYRRLSKYADIFIPAWIDAHNGLVDWHANHGLTKMEHIAAMLFRKGFTVKEVAYCMSISVNTVKRHISMAYQKTDSKRRDQLPKNLIR